MKIKIIQKIVLFLFLSSLFTVSLYSQSIYSAGGYIGGGFVGGFGANQGSFAASFFFDINTGFSDDFLVRPSFIYARDFSYILPGSLDSYFPYVQGFSLKGIISQNYGSKYFFEEGLGFLLLNDRTFFNVNEWDWGIAFSAAAGMNLTKAENLKIGTGLEYGLTFTNHLSEFFSLYVQLQVIL